MRDALFGALPFIVGALVARSVCRRAPAGGPAGQGREVDEGRGVGEVRVLASLVLGLNAFTTTTLLTWQYALFPLSFVMPSLLLAVLVTFVTLATAWAEKRDFALACGALASNTLPFVALMLNPPLA